MMRSRTQPVTSKCDGVRFPQKAAEDYIFGGFFVSNSLLRVLPIEILHQHYDKIRIYLSI